MEKLTGGVKSCKTCGKDTEVGFEYCDTCEKSYQDYKAKNEARRKEKAAEAEKQKPFDKRQVEYGKTLHAPVKEETAESIFSGAMNFLSNKINKKSKRSEFVTYENARILFWNFYSELVKKENGEYPVISSDPNSNEKEFLKKFVKWLIGENEGEVFNPSKSLIICGDNGVGKSTAARTGFFLMDYFRVKFGWNDRSYKYANMDNLFLETYTKQSLEKIGDLAKGGYCLDEVREEHLNYKHYGQDHQIINDVLSARYNIWEQDKINTIITTNLSPRVFMEKLNDDRLAHRMKQQYIIFELRGLNKREL